MFGAPWHRYTLGGHTLRLQVLDVTTAFARESELVENFDGLALQALAAPAEVFAGLRSSAAKTDNPEAALLRMAARVGARLLEGLPADGVWLGELFGDFVLGRLSCEARTIETWSEFAELRLAPVDRWRLLGLQLAQTYGPLWARSPYDPGSRTVPDYGVKAPDSPLAVQWAKHLAPEVNASTREILREWTPIEMIEQVELMAMHAEISRRAQDAAAAKSSG